MIEKKSFLRRCLGLCWGTLATGIILFALMVAVGRMLLPMLADYRIEIQQAVSEQLGRDVRIGQIHTDWSGVWPRIHLSEIDVLNRKNEKWLHIKDVMLSVDLGLIWNMGKKMPAQVSLVGIKLDIRRNKGRSFSVNGENFALDKKSPVEQEDIVRWLFSLDSVLRIKDSEVSWRDLRLQDKAISISASDVTLVNNSNQHRVFGRLRISEQKKETGQLSFILNMKGNMLEPQKVSHNFYLNGDIHVNQWMRDWIRPYLAIQRGHFSVQVWGKGSLGQVDDVKSIVKASQLAWKKKSGSHSGNAITKLDAKVFWNRFMGGWSLDVEELSMAVGNKNRKLAQVSLVYNRQVSTGLQQLEMALSHIQLKDMHVMLSKYLTTAKLGQFSIDELAPEGELEKLQVRLNGNEKKISHYYASAVFNGLGFERANNLPGVRGLDGRFLLTEKDGVMEFKSRSAMLDFGQVFEKPINALVEGNLFWRKTDSGITLESDRIVARNDHVNTISSIKVIIPHNGKPFLDMATGIKDGDARFARLYFPHNIMAPSVLTWLQQALVRGQATKGKLVFRGQLEQFPFYHNEGTFIVDFDVRNLDLKFGSGWPALSGIDANVRFNGPGLFVGLDKGMLMQTSVLPSVLKIKDLSKTAKLDMDVHLKGAANSLLDYLRKSPLNSKAKRFLSSVRSDGSLQTNISMVIPLLHPDKFSLKGYADLKNTNVYVKPVKKAFNKINGRLNFEIGVGRHEFSAKNIKLYFQGKPASLNVFTTKGGRADSHIVFKMATKLAISELFKDQLPSLVTVFNGESGWQMEYRIQPDNNARLVMTSNLQGTEIKLPDQFYKPGNLNKNISLTIDVDKTGLSLLALKLDGMINMLSHFTIKGFDRGVLWLGKKARLIKVSQKPGMVIGGHLPLLSVSRWLDLFPVSSGVVTNTSIFSQIRAIDLKVSKLESGHLVLNKLRINASRTDEYLRANIEAKEVSGKVYIPDSLAGDVPIKLRLDYLKLKTYADKAESAVPDPRNLPALDVESKKIILNGKTLGSLRFNAVRMEKGLRIDGLRLRGQYITADADGTWYLKESWHQSKFNVHVSTPHIGNAMDLFRYKSSFAEGEASAKLTASWSGPPHWLEMKRLDGQIKLLIKKGRLKDIDPGSGRIFGLLSIQSLQRRLSLDFSDFFRKGFSFDRIEGSFTVSEGDAYTNNLFLDGPAARIDISGRIGLSSEDYDETVYVTPKVSSSIPLLGLAAGPQVAVGLLLTEKLFRKDVNKMTARSYSVTGSWEKPVITKNKPEVTP